MSRRADLPVALVAIIFCACGGATPPPPAQDVLLITIDTARADRFSYVAPGGPGTPHVDALAVAGAGFTNAITPVPLTLPAHASIMTGRLPPSHTLRDNGFYKLPAAESTLAEVLKGAGFTTAAFIGAEVLDGRYGLNQGFDTYDDRMVERGPAGVLAYPERRGAEVAGAALAWLEEKRGLTHLFVWVHLFDPHTPYMNGGYDGEIAYVDRVIGGLLAGWEEKRGAGKILVVITADHGEALGAHGEKTHGVLVHDATLRVPLVVRVPGRKPSGLIRAPVSLIDVMPTILGQLGIAVPAGVQGRDLGPVLSGGSVPWSVASGYAESLYAQLHHGCTPLTALREDGYKLVRGASEELFDVETDPDELKDLAAAEVGRKESLERSLESFVSSLKEEAAEPATLDDEARRSLAALGYASAPPVDAGGTRDPKEALVSLARMADADRSAMVGDLAGAIASYRSVLAAEPKSIDARLRLAELLSAHGRHAEAAALFAEAVEIAPKEPYLRRKLGNALEAVGKFADALAAYDAGLAIDPHARDLRTGRWSCLDRLRRWSVMLREAEAAVAADPTDGAARLARAIACCGQGSDKDYAAALDRELAALPGDPILTGARSRLPK
ncbi:MAG TPA: sulfatase-like hydrolase/transferase [Candidatus Polarisedimenticolaceae bacterium]|nr:sulfatase-like hydrolase/transferase [Candidatus Polarisedimenticolaceae bacterium]